MLKAIETKEEALALPPDAKFIIKGANGDYLLRPRAGSTPDVTEAHLYSPGDSTYWTGHRNGIAAMWELAANGEISLWLIVPDGEPGKVPIERLFNASQIELMKQAPRNESVRAIIMSKVGQMPPPEVVEFEPLKAWIEATAKPVISLHPAPGKPTLNQRLELDFQWSGTEHGCCTYTANCSGQDFSIYTAQELSDLASGCECFSDLVEELAKENQHEGDPSGILSRTGDISYDEYEPNEEDAYSDIEVALASPASRIKDFIRQNLPEVAERLGL